MTGLMAVTKLVCPKPLIHSVVFVLKAPLTKLPTVCSHCAAVFCYACGSRWKTCSCPRFGGPDRANSPRIEEAVQIDTLNFGDLLLDEVPDDIPDLIEADGPAWGSDDSEPANVPPRPSCANAARISLPPQSNGFLESMDSAEDTAGDDIAPATTRTLRPALRRSSNPHRQRIPPTEPHDRPGHPRPASLARDWHTWQLVHGGGECQSCNRFMPYYLFQCRVCGILSCARCR